MITPGQFKIGDVARIKGILPPDERYNGMEVLIKSKPFLHGPTNTIFIKVEIDTEGDYALSPWNLEKVSQAQYDAYVDHHYLDPNDDSIPQSQLNKPIRWDQCIWQPDPNFKRDNYEI